MSTMTAYEYRCSNGHWLTAPEPLESCAGCGPDGRECDGDLRLLSGPRRRKQEAGR
ncbi:MAG: hypothetical protein LC798_03200 [Chloroflexi bacterium]|nr:hypothetical protein [Chloroflexota bacterium]